MLVLNWSLTPFNIQTSTYQCERKVIARSVVSLKYLRQNLEHHSVAKLLTEYFKQPHTERSF